MKEIPINALPLFPRLNGKLIEFLKQLSPDDWDRPTVARQWNVKDVTAHLVDVTYRRIALHRDGWSPLPGVAIESYEDLVRYLNGLNADWVKAMKRLSPAMLVEMLERAGEEVVQLFNRLDPFAPSVWPVSWAGESLSLNWFDIAREYTERWLHQQQIREALGNEELLSREFYHPLLSIFLQAWPYVMKEADAPEGTVLQTTIEGPGGGEWRLQRQGGVWVFHNQPGDVVAAETIIDGRQAWKLFSKSRRKEEMPASIRITGNEGLGERVLDMVSVMA